MALRHTYRGGYAPTSRMSWLARVRKRSNYLFVVPMLLYTTLTMAYPIFVNIQMSLYDVNVSTFRSGNAPFVGLDNYLKLLHDP
ncbi:MAG: hypothetical protein U0521_26120, partial [Anaerolineae bacterium]